MRIKDSPETGITMEPSPKGWLWALAGVVVLGGVGTGAWFATHHAPRKMPLAAKAPHPAKKATASTSTVSTTPPNNYVAAPPKGTSLFTQMAAINNKYIAWADQQISLQVPAIPSSGPYAGTLTPAVLNNPLTLKKWPGPLVPTSLQAAGVKLPLGTPANGNFVGLTPQFLAAELADNHGAGSIPGLTAPMIQQAITTAGDFIMALNGNNPASALQYLDPYHEDDRADQILLADSMTTPITQEYTASAANGGMLSLRQTQYESWISVTYPNPAVKQFTVLFPDVVNSPQGHVIAALYVGNLTFHAIGSGLVNGKLIIGQYVAPAGAYMALIQDHGQSRWYAIGIGEDNFDNTPAAIYWTAP
jgi:hypothetical protein